MTEIERRLKKAREEEEEEKKEQKKSNTATKTSTQTNRSAASSYSDTERRLQKSRERSKPYTAPAASRRSAIQRKTESWMNDLTQAEPGARSAIQRYNALEDAKYYNEMQNRGMQIGDDDMARRGAAGVKDSTKRWKAGFDAGSQITAPVAAETVQGTKRKRDYWDEAGKQAAAFGDQARLVSSVHQRQAAERDMENASARQREEYKRQLEELRRTRPAEYYALTMTDDEIDRSIAYFDYEGKNPVTRSVYVERTPEEEARYLRGLRQARFLGESDREREAFVKGEKDRYDKQVRAYENRRTAMDDVTGRSLQNVTDTGDWVAYFDRSPKEQAEFLNNLRRARFIGESDEERAANIQKEQEHYAEQFRNYRNGPEYQEALTEAEIDARSNIEALERAKAIHQLERARQTPESIEAGRAALRAQQDQLLADNGYGIERKKVPVYGMHHQKTGERTVVTDKRPTDSRSIQEMTDKGWVLSSNFYALPEEQQNAVYAVAATDTEQAVVLAQYYLKLAEDEAYQKIYDWVNKDDGSGLGGRLKQLGRRAVGLVGGTAAKLASGLDPYGAIGQDLSKLGNAAIGGGAASASRTGLFSIEALGGDESPISSDVPFIGRGNAGTTYQVGASVLQSAAIAAPAMLLGNYSEAAAKVAEVLGTTLMGSSAAADDYTQCIQNGMTVDQARLHATWAGINEAAFEYISLDKLVDPDLTVSALRRWLEQGGIEASEEVCTSIANRISDSLVANYYGIENSVERRTRQLMEQGLSYRAAYSKAENEWLTEVTMDGMSGFLSGLIMGGGSEAVRGVETFRQNRANRSSTAPGPMLQTETGMADETGTTSSAELRPAPSPQGEGFGSETRDQGRGTTDERAAGWGQPALRTEDGSAGTRDAGQARQNEAQTVNRQNEQVEQGRSDAQEMDSDELGRAVEHWSGLMETAREENNQEVVNRYGGYLEGLRQVQQERANAETGANSSAELRSTPSPQGEGFGRGTEGTVEPANDLGLAEGLGRVGAKDNQTGVSASTGTTSSAELRPAPSPQGEGFGRGTRAVEDAGPYDTRNETDGDAGSGALDVRRYGDAGSGALDVRRYGDAETRGVGDAGTYDGINREGGLNDGAYGRDQGGAAEFGRAGAAETGTAEAGTAESAADSGQRDAGLGAGRSAGELGEGTEGSVGRGQRAAEQARLRNQIRALETERTSAKQIGIRGGTKNESLRVVPEELYTSEMREIANEVAELGQKVTFVAGAMEVRGSSGKTGKANGIHQVNRDGSVQYFIRADSAKYTAGTIFKHESFHELVSRNQNLWLDMVEDLFKTHTEEEVYRMVDAYVEALDGIYGAYEAGMTEDDQTALRNKYLEEIFADQYAGMNRGGEKQSAARDLAGETAQRFAGDIENARQNRAGIERRNGPGTRLSVDDSDRQFLNDTEMFDTIAFLVDEMVQDGKFVSVNSEEILKMKEQYDWNDEDKAREAIKQILGSVAGVRVRFSMNGKTVTAYLTRDGIKHAGGNNNTPEKAATYKKFLELVDKSEYAGSQYDKRLLKISEEEAKKPGADRIDKFTAAAVVDEKVYAVVFVTKDIALDSEHHIYAPYMQEETSVSNNGISQQNAGNAQPIYGASKVSEKIITDEASDVKKKDREYLEAVKYGDTETAQRMVNEAAKRAGYDMELYHGSKKGGGFTVFKDWQYFTANKAYAERYMERDNPDSLYHVYVKSERMFDTRRPECREIFEQMRSEYGLSKLQENGLPDWTDGYDISDFIEENDLEYDGVVLDEGGDLTESGPVSRGLSYIIRNSEQVKSAGAVTYDDSGNVIPLSERFRTDRTGNEEWKNKDIRFSPSDADDESLGVDWIGSREEAAEANPSTTASEAQRSPSPVTSDRGGQDAGRGTTENPSSVTDKSVTPALEDASSVGKADETAMKSSTVHRTVEPHEGEGSETSGQAVGDSDENSGDMTAVVSDHYGAEEYKELAREKKVSIAEKASIEGMKSRIQGAETRLRALQVMESTGLLAKDEQSQKEWRQQIKDVQESLDIYKKALKEKQEARKAEKADKAKREEKKQQRKAEKKARAKEAEAKGDKPRQARKEFRTDALNLFSVPAGKRQALGGILNDFADKVIDQGSVSETDRRDLFRQLYEAGAELAGPADDTTREIRDFVKSGRIYVPQEVRSEFGDDWIAFNQRAWGNRIHFTRDINDRGIDSWNAELAEVFPGSFDADETDLRTILENIVELAEEGKGERVSIAEMMRRNQNETGVTIDEQMDELERKVDQLIDTFAQKAELEVKVRKQGTMQLIKERQYNREQVERQAQRKQDNDTRREVMKQLQQLNKMRKKTKPEIQKQIDKIIGNLDTMARSISPEGLENLQELSRKYAEASEDPNFLGNPYVEARLARLNQVQLNDLEISDVIELGRTISALVKTITEDKRLLTDERNKEISAAAEAANREIRNSRGSKGGQLRNFVSTDHLSPTRQIQRLGGWLRGGQMEQLSRSLEEGGVRRMNYQMQATRIFDGFLAEKENQKWMKKAQGKDAEWITVKAPVGITDENGTVKVKFETFEITPMMRVGLLMHSKNVDNLRHIETGGIVIPQKEAYRKGNLGEADARGTRVKMRPETVRAIVKDCTAQEKAFASLLERYYDQFSKEKINEVSMLIDGFERAGGDHYYGIKVSKKFLAAQPEQVQRNLALDSIGSIVNERVHAGNPIILEDASTALADHIDLISKYYGYTAAIRDFNAVMNYTFHEGATGDEAANAYAGSVKETLQDKWGDGAQKYLDKLLADLQQSSGINETAAKFLAKLRGNLAGASLMFNPAVAFSQTASLPGAAQSLGFDALIAGLKPAKVDMGFIEKYSPVLWYRNQGNSTQELGDYMKEKGLEGKLPWAFNWIQKMDSWTIRRLWAAAEYRVSRDTDLSPGSQAEIDAGTDPFYQEVARVFQRAVFDTQPNYSEMQRPAILRSESDLTKMLTMYKTVPLQYYNMMYEAVGRLQADKARLKQNATKENQANYQESKRFAAKTFAGVLSANVVYVVMKAAIKGLTGRDRRFRDEDGNLDVGIIFKELNKDLLETYAGSIIGAGDLLNAGEKLFDAFTTGSYSRYGGTEISALSAIEDTLGGLYNMAKELHDQDLTGGLGAIKDFAKQLAMNAGIPANNLETYLLSVVKWVSPEWADRYENFFDEFEREDLKGEHGRNLRAAIRVLMDNRTEGLKDETVDELMRLWEAGQNAAIPSAIPSSVAINGEDVAIRGSDKSKYRDQWSQAVSKNLEQLLATEAYEAADDKGKARMIAKLYEFANQQAAASVTGKETDAWVDFGKACETAGIPLEDYLAAATITKDSLKELDGTALEDAVRGRMRLRAGELDDKVVEELSRLYEAGETGSVPGDVPTSLSVNSEEVKLTAEQRAAWLQAWKKTTAENLEGLIGSKAYGKADDANKAKMVAALYELAAEGAKKEVIPDAPTRERWMEAGFAVEELGVPLSDYVAFHNLLSGVENAKDKIQLLKNQGWNNKQNETIWLKAFADETQEKKFRNLKNGGANWADAMAVMDIGGDATEGLTEAQLKVYNQRWDALTGETTKRLMQTKAYKNADAEGREALVDKLNTYASAVAKAEATKKDSKESWINAGIAATKQGVKLEEYIVFMSQLSEIDGKDDEDESVDGLARQRQLELLNATGWTDEQKETVFLKSSMTKEPAEEKYKALRSAGLTWNQTSTVMGTLGSNGNKARAITETKASEDVKLKALEVYLSETQYKSAKACRSFDVKLNLWLQSKVSADAKGNDRVTQEEAENYVSGLNISWQEKAYLWQLLCPSTKTVKGTYPDTWKDNPFSTTLGRELWRYLYGNG